jgi:hypothetical protein
VRRAAAVVLSAGILVALLARAQGMVPIRRTATVTYTPAATDHHGQALEADSLVVGMTDGGIGLYLPPAAQVCWQTADGGVGPSSLCAQNQATGELRVALNAGIVTGTMRTTGPTTAQGGLRFTQANLVTCNSANETLTLWVVGTGGNNATATKLCRCRSLGSGVYKWRNVDTNTEGDATTCP